ncbi:MAG: alkaline phosphatase family protein [Candidatus Bathyarchaeota archaeon]|nr:MAG: alkaline phosphatase family protein [Candidatus Bathyarchaeota archaeon]
MSERKVLVIGLDCAPPELLFTGFVDGLPNLKKLLQHGIHARMKSSHPPITIPAWMVMSTSKSMGKLELYGFRHRKPGTYNEILLANSYSVKEKTVWDILGEHGKKVIVIGVPPAYPPRPVNGYLISGFMTPSTEKDYTYPKELKKEIENLVGEYVPDIVFRTEEKDKMLKQLHETTEKRFKVIEYLMENKPWDFLMFVEIGVDRVHHAFWKFFDKQHHLYQPGNKYENVVKEYYRLVDNHIGKLLKLADKNTTVIVVSDHGAKRMKGAFCVNEWLIKKGYLKLKKKPEKTVSLEKAEVNWGKTKAWGWGGYHARIFLNVKGREPQGTIHPKDYKKFRKQLIKDLEAIRGPNGEKWDTQVYTPEEIYPDGKGNYPDLTVYFDNLNWRSAGTIGYNSPYLSENDKGPDDAVHSHYGVFILYDSSKEQGKKIEDINLLDVAPTILEVMRIPVPPDMEGKIVKEAA